MFINNKEHFVLSKEKTTIKEHMPLKEILLFLTNKKVITVDKNGYSIYKIINFGPSRFEFRILWRIKKKQRISF